jgi:hypothetical protein
MEDKCAKKLKWLFTVLLLVQATAQAAYYLPESSFWQGARFYDQGGIYAYVEYAVYNTAASSYHNAFDGLTDGFINPGSGQYIYAYQVSNLGSELEPIAIFELLGGNSSAADGIGSQDDGYGGLLPLNDGESFEWRFLNGIFTADEHSAFMAFSSDNAPITGSFRLSTLDEYGDEPPINGGSGSGDVPEPAVAALLAVGIIRFAVRRNWANRNTD